MRRVFKRERSIEWLDHVEKMVRRGTTYSKLVNDLKTNYDVEISEKTLATDPA